MIVTVFSDLHAHPYKEGKILENGLNSRLVDCLNVLNKVYDFADKYSGYVLFGGDMFHARKKMDVSAFNAVFETVAKRSAKGVTHLLPGNHDQYNKQGTIHSLEPFDNLPRVHVIKKPEWINLGKDIAVYAIPFVPDSADFFKHLRRGMKKAPKNKLKVGLFHVGIDKTKVGKGSHSHLIKSDVKIQDLKPEFWDLILIGHYHTCQKLASNVHYIGAPLQHSWSDEGEDRGLIAFNSQGKVKRVSLESPKFITLTSDEVVNFDKTNDFIRVIFNKKPSDSEIDTVKNKLGDSLVSVTVREDEIPVLARTELSLTMDHKEMLKQYVNFKQPTLDFEPEFTLKAGLNIIKEAENHAPARSEN